MGPLRVWSNFKHILQNNVINTFIHTHQLLSLAISKNGFIDTFILPRAVSLNPKAPTSLCSQSDTESIYSTSINETLVPSLPALTLLDTRRNPFICDCRNAWAKSNNQTTKYNYPYDLKDTKLFDLDTYSSSETRASPTSSPPLLWSSSPRWGGRWSAPTISSWLISMTPSKGTAKLLIRTTPFVSYNAHDEPWILRELPPELEGEQGWKLSLQHRDVQPGKTHHRQHHGSRLREQKKHLCDQLANTWKSSGAPERYRKTMLDTDRSLLGKLALCIDLWSNTEIKGYALSSFRLFDKQKDVLILVFLEEIPDHQLSPYHHMRRLVKRRTYLSWPRAGPELAQSWPRAGEHTEVFWQKLWVALETRDCPDEENPILTGTAMVGSERRVMPKPYAQESASSLGP
ncbi:unnamed protein product, partial [Coregonus sp. 'balchen']